MKQYLNLIISMSLFILMTCFVIIKTNEPEIIAFKKVMHNTIIGELDKNSELKRNLPKNFEIVIVPSCYISVNQSINKESSDVNDFIIDSTLGYGVIKSQDKVLAVASKISTSYSFLDNELIKPQIKFLEMIKFSMQYSDNPFFVYFFNDEKYWNDVIGFYSDGNISFIDENFHIYSDIKEIIKSRYGSVEKYLEIVEDTRYKEQLKNKIKNIEEAKAIVKNDYVQWENEFPLDTLEVFNLFITEMDSIVKLSVEQKALIKQKVIDRIRKYQLRTYARCGIPFYNEDITYEVKSILTKNQFEKYLEQRAIKSWLVTEASKNIYYYLKREIKTPEDLIEDYYKQEVFGK